MINRTQVTALGLSAAALVSIALSEGYRSDAYIPVPGDVPTIGFGETSGVKLGDKITPERALAQLLVSADKHANIVRKCANAKLYQWEFDAFTSLTYTIGHGAKGKDGFCINKEGNQAIIPRRLASGDYKGACEAILMYGNFQGKPNKGLATRRQKEYALCIGPDAAPSNDTGRVVASGSGL